MKSALGNYEYITNQTDVPRILEEINSYCLSISNPYIGFDTETTGLDIFKLKLLLFQIEVNEKVYVIDARKVDVLPFKYIFEDAKITKIIQNAKFDYKVMYVTKGFKIQGIYDTCIAQLLIEAGKRNKGAKLVDLASFYCSVKLDKGVAETFVDFDKEFTKEQLDYAAADVFVLPQIMKLQRTYIRLYKLDKIAALEFKLVESVAHMELVGFQIDKEKWRSSLRETKKKLFDIRSNLRLVLPDPLPLPDKPLRHKKDGTLYKSDQNRLDNPKPTPVLNLDSWQQVLNAMSVIGIDLQKVNKKTRAGNTNVNTLRAATYVYSNEFDKVEIINNFIRYRSLKQIEKTFGENLLSWADDNNRIHSEFHQNGTDSGRFSSSNPNLQNIQKKGEEGKILRSCFIPAKGYKFIIADYSQIELRIAAELSGDPTMLRILNDPSGDIHKSTAGEMYGLDYDSVTADLRRAAKTLNFGIIYGMVIKTLAERINCSYEEAIVAMDKYRKTYPVLMEWVEDEGNKALKSGQSRTIGDRVRWFPVLNKYDINFEKQSAFYKRVGRNHPVQGTSADMTKSAMIILFNPLWDLNAWMVNTIHDELCVETPVNNTFETSNLVKNKMIIAGKKYLNKVPVLVDIKIRDCWWKDDEAQDDENCQQHWLMPPTWLDTNVFNEYNETYNNDL